VSDISYLFSVVTISVDKILPISILLTDF